MLVFLHISKAAGTSFGAALMELAPRACPFVTDELLRQDLAGLADYDLLIGHMTVHALARYLPDAGIMTMLRHPIPRAISQYQSWHDFPVDENWRPSVERDKVVADALAFTKRADIHEFFASEWGPITRQFTNYQTYILSGCDVLTTPFEVWDAKVLQAAKDNLRSMKLVGIAERMDESVAFATEVIGGGVSVPRAKAYNRSGRRSEEWRDPDVVRRIESCSPMDLELYTWAKEEFDRRVGAPRTPQA
jgi:hypothetical protein